MDNQKYNKYDTICYIINANLYSYGTRHNKTINLGHFNLKDKKHLFLLEMAKMTSQIYGFNIILEIPWYKKI